MHIQDGETDMRACVAWEQSGSDAYSDALTLTGWLTAEGRFRKGPVSFVEMRCPVEMSYQLACSLFLQTGLFTLC